MKIFQKIRSVRSVLTLWYSLILIAALTAFGIGVYLYLQRLERAELERNLREEVDWISRIIDVERGRLDGKTSLDSLSSDVQDLILDHFSVNPRNYIVSLSSTGG